MHGGAIRWLSTVCSSHPTGLQFSFSFSNSFIHTRATRIDNFAKHLQTFICFCCCFASDSFTMEIVREIECMPRLSANTQQITTARTNKHSILILLKCFMDYGNQKTTLIRFRMNIDWLNDGLRPVSHLFILLFQSFRILSNLNVERHHLALDANRRFPSGNQKLTICQQFMWFTGPLLWK